MGQFLSNRLREQRHPSFAALADVIEPLDIALIPADKGFPLKEGFELYIGTVDEKPNPKQKFAFQVALNEPGIIEGKPLLETLHQFASLVEGIVAALRPRLG